MSTHLSIQFNINEENFFYFLDKPEEALNLPPEDINNSTCYSPVRMKKIKTYDY